MKTEHVAAFRWHELLPKITLRAALDFPVIHVSQVPAGTIAYRLERTDESLPCPCGCAEITQVPVDIVVTSLAFGWYRIDGLTPVFEVAIPRAENLMELLPVGRVPEFHARTWGNEW